MAATAMTATESAEGKRIDRAPNLGLFTLANAISVSRIIGGPLVVLALSFGTATGAWVALAVMVLAEISDMADGHVARRSGTVDRVGKILDPLADSLYRATVKEETHQEKKNGKKVKIEFEIEAKQRKNQKRERKFDQVIE
eukprot:TRINITY_DN81572_c0_g1_i1.p4 TRINITY_DN81572_c0_g1~~TRINITY_DN81572_c0_g1_i1.p4  ORF type:complete len:141 (-),score=21.11 TRINITY_DN81572_c0_g1_i1:20-442(-)